MNRMEHKWDKVTTHQTTLGQWQGLRAHEIDELIIWAEYMVLCWQVL